MIRSKITKELIELSKKARELGFPQDVEEGDWIGADSVESVDKVSLYLYDQNFSIKKGVFTADDYYDVGVYIDETMLCNDDEWFLILSFSRCLEWLKNQRITLRLDELIVSSHVQLYGMKNEHTELGDRIEGKTHHEAIAKAVVKILEVEDE